MFKLFRYHPPTKSAEPPGQHVLVFDGGCDFCRAFVQFIRRHARTDVTLISFSNLEQKGILTCLEEGQIGASAHYISPDGTEYHGGESITRALRLVPGGRAFAVLNLWGVALFRELGYGLVASNRPLASKLARLLSRGDIAASCSGDDHSR